MQAVLAEVLGTIETMREEGRPVLVHCHGGASRTGLILRTWLVHSRHLTATQATAEARQLWSATDTWTISFDEALEAWCAR